MKKSIIYALIILICTVFIAAIPTEAEGAIYEDTIRLHILANSDSTEDQDLKIKLRDEILDKYSDYLGGYDDFDAAYKGLEKKLAEIESFGKEKIKCFGYDYDVKVSLTKEWYDTRVYENFALPKGYYTSLQIIIGEGEGKNWWCVMFPPLCLDMSVSNSNYSEEEQKLICGEYQVKFKILELISDISK